MNRIKLRDRIRAEFGPHLERVTPAGAREFLEKLYREMYSAAQADGPIEVSGSARSYEQIMSEFFSSMLDVPAEDAAVMLWLWAFEQHFTAMEQEYSERFKTIFGKFEIPFENSDE